MRPTEDFLNRFEKVKALRDDRWEACCPGHDDRTPSLSIMRKPNGDWLLHCHAGCELERVLEPVGLEQRDLFTENGNGNGHREIEAVYPYVDEDGKPLFEVVRFEGKQFRQRRPDGVGGWEWKLGDTRRVLYRLPRIVEAVKRGEDVMVVEGEKDVHALEKLGIAATCNPAGAGKWKSVYNDFFRGAKVTIVADKDEPGRAHARQVAESLEGIATEINVVECAKGKDISDHLAAGGSIAEIAVIEPKMLSASKEPPVAESISDLPFTLVGDVIANAPPEPEWIWEGYMAPGSLTLFAGRPKVGKSTLKFGLIAAMLHGRPFVGRTTRCRGVLLLSEEGPDTLAEKARMFGIADHPRFHLLLRRQVQAPWPEVVARARDYCREHDLDVMVVDTFDKWTGLRGDDENRSGPVLEALEPLMQAAGDGITVALISHQRKASGDHGEAVRGSNALTGAVDVIVEIERVADVPHARGLYGTSRFASTPEELAVELTDDGYAPRGDIEALKKRSETERVMDQLSDDESTSAEIADATEIPEATVRRRLSELHADGRVERVGKGVKNSPHRWKMLSATAYPLVAERKNGGPPEQEATPEEEALVDRLLDGRAER